MLPIYRPVINSIQLKLMKSFLNLLCILIGFCLLRGEAALKEPARTKWKNIFKKGDGILAFFKDESIKDLLSGTRLYFKVVMTCSFGLFAVLQFLHFHALNYFLSLTFVVSCFYYLAIYWIYQHKSALFEILIKNWMVWAVIATMVLSCVAEFSFNVKIPEWLSLKALFRLWHIQQCHYWVGLLLMFCMLFTIIYLGYWMIFLGLVLPLVLLLFVMQIFLKWLFKDDLEPFKFFLCVLDLVINYIMNQFL